MNVTVDDLGIVVVVTAFLASTYEPPNAAYDEKTEDGTDNSQSNSQTLPGGGIGSGT